jgi:UDP-glucose 4-epimerase
MEKHDVKNMVFSSSATVYGEPEFTPVRESARLGPVTNPYGKTKLFIEEVLRDQCTADSDWNVCLLRYVHAGFQRGTCSHVLIHSTVDTLTLLVLTYLASSANTHKAYRITYCPMSTRSFRATCHMSKSLETTMTR